MANTIGGNNNIPPGMNIYKFNQSAQKAAFQRGEVGNLGRKETRQELREQKDGFSRDDIQQFTRLKDGRTRTEYSNRTTEYKAGNGVRKKTDKKGWSNIDLPNGYMIELRPDGESRVFNKETGEFLKADYNKETPNSHGKVSFQDTDGNKWEVNDTKLSFQVQNKSETLTQKMNPDGSMELATKTLSRDPDSGRFSQDGVKLRISPGGRVTGQNGELKDISLNNNQINYIARGELNMGIKFPYQIPGRLSGNMVKPDLKPPIQEPVMPPPAPSSPPPTMGGSQAMNAPAFTPYPYVADPFAQFPYPGFPGPGNLPPNPGETPAQTPPANDPYSPVMTPGGMIRKHEPDGSMFISLPNGVVMNKMADGKCQAFDSQYPEKVLPVTSHQVNNPGYGPEERYTFQDGAGNIVNLYSKSMDMQVSSKDGNVMQNISPNGDILITARTYPKGENGQAKPSIHKVLVGANGRVNTFGEKGIQVNNKNIVFAENGNITNYALPYQIPMEQGLMPGIPPVGYQPPGQIPVPDPYSPCPHPYPGYTYGPQNGGFTPPPAGASVNIPGENNMGRFVQVQKGPDGAYHPTEKQPHFEMGEDGILRSSDGEKPEPETKVVDTSPKASPKANEPPTEKPVKKGLWQKIKDFFTGNSDPINDPERPESQFHGHGCNEFDGCYYNPYGGMYSTGMGMGTAAMLGLSAGAMLGSAMMWPMGMYCNPFGMWGMYGMW
ncbi:MAG: hypothetical protein ACLFQV_02110 [Vulcanimicrobiota bacterium]